MFSLLYSGQSKYHYVGLEVSPEGEFAGMKPTDCEEAVGVALRKVAKKKEEGSVGR